MISKSGQGKTAVVWEDFVDDIYHLDGRLFWNKSPNNRVRVGDEVGGLNKDGYRRFKYKGSSLLVHRAIWFYLNKVWPTYLDHINRDKASNNICNLREVTRRQNLFNTTARSNNKTGFKGVSMRGSRFYAFFDGGYLGTFDTAESAALAYNTEVSKLSEIIYLNEVTQ